MTKITVGQWRQSIDLLDEGYDATGIYWRTRPQLGPGSPVLHAHFSGNFWWTKASYIKTLGPPLRTNRYDAEAWIGYNENIKQYELRPGVPQVQGPVALPKKVNKIVYDPDDYNYYIVDQRVQGPHGMKLKPGQVVYLADSPYVQILLKGGHIYPWSQP